VTWPSLGPPRQSDLIASIRTPPRRRGRPGRSDAARPSQVHPKPLLVMRRWRLTATSRDRIRQSEEARRTAAAQAAECGGQGRQEGAYAVASASFAEALGLFGPGIGARRERRWLRATIAVDRLRIRTGRRAYPRDRLSLAEAERAPAKSVGLTPCSRTPASARVSAAQPDGTAIGG
jgi:hypothetical protein